MITTATNRYNVFGGVLRTTLGLPELHPAPEDAEDTWTLEVHEIGDRPVGSFDWAAVEDLSGGISVRLERAQSGASRLTYTDTGTFDISADGTRIDWYRSKDAREHLARTDILGRVLSVAMHSSGVLMLHASAVSIKGQVAGFLAPKFYGKSTLACALTDAGAQLVTDDALAVRLGRRAECSAGVPEIRLRGGSANFLRGFANPESDSADWRHLEKHAVTKVMQQWSPVAAFYVLDPRMPHEMPAVATRDELFGSAAAMALVRFAKLGGLLSGALAVEYLGLAAALSSRARVYTLSYARDLARLNEVAEAVLTWHRD